MDTTLGHGAAMDAIEAAFTRHAGTLGTRERNRNLFYAARMLTDYTGASYVDAVYALASKFDTADSIAQLPSRAARARA